MNYRSGTLRVLGIGLVIGLIVGPLLWIGLVSGTAAQSLPFTPTTEPTEPATVVPTAIPATIAPTALPATTAPTPTPTVQGATPTTDILPTPPPFSGTSVSEDATSDGGESEGESSTPRPTATALPAGYGRDRCDPNHGLTQPCALATETDVADLSFTDDPTDVFSFLLKGGRQYRISASVSSAGGLDPQLDVFLAGNSEQPIASNDDIRLGDPSAAVTVTVQADAWYLVRVVNKSPGDVNGKTYTVSARSVAAANSAPAVATNPDDLVGNAYDVAHAVRLAWNVPYDLTMACPDTRPNACYSGRHTFLLVPVKGAVPFTALTYDLGAGVDTVLTLYKPDPTQQSDGPGLISGWRAVASNDDVAAGWTLRSQISLVPDWNSVALLVVAPSDRADLPPIPSDGRPGRYRLIVGSPELPNIKAALGGQQDQPPTPVPATPRPTGQAAPVEVSTQQAADNREVIKEACATGLAVVKGEGDTGFFAAAPPAQDDLIASYAAGALVQLLGECYGGWVKVQPQDSVTPGWMRAARLSPEALATTPLAPPNGTPGTAPSLPGGTAASEAGTALPTSTSGPAAPIPLPAPVLTPLEPLALPSAVALPPIARVLTVEACTAGSKADTCNEPIAGVEVTLSVAATRQRLTSNRTDGDGRVTLSVSVPPDAAARGSQLLLTIPALGVETVLDDAATDVPVRVSAGELDAATR